MHQKPDWNERQAIQQPTIDWQPVKQSNTGVSISAPFFCPHLSGGFSNRACAQSAVVERLFLYFLAAMPPLSHRYVRSIALAAINCVTEKNFTRGKRWWWWWWWWGFRGRGEVESRIQPRYKSATSTAGREKERQTETHTRTFFFCLFLFLSGK